MKQSIYGIKRYALTFGKHLYCQGPSPGSCCMQWCDIFHHEGLWICTIVEKHLHNVDAVMVLHCMLKGRQSPRLGENGVKASPVPDEQLQT